jgi:hypothetical protein
MGSHWHTAITSRVSDSEDAGFGTTMNSFFTCPSSRPRAAAGLLTVVVCSLSGCGLWAIEPDEIDIADDDVGDTAGGTDEGNEGNDDPADDNGLTGESDTGQDGTDTFGEEGTGDGDGDTGTDASDTSDPGMCGAEAELVVGPNDVAVANATSNLSGACGGAEGESIYSFTADAAGDYSMAISGADFSAVLYAIGADCTELTEPCSADETPVMLSLSAGETTLLVVDSEGGTGSATLTITGP